MREKWGVLAPQVPKRVGRQAPASLQSDLNELLRLDPEHTRAHYVHYLNQLEHADFPAAVDSLHRYFDFSAAQLTAGNADSGGAMGAALGAASWQARAQCYGWLGGSGDIGCSLVHNTLQAPARLPPSQLSVG